MTEGKKNWSALGGLMFAARRVVEGLWAGRHGSATAGSGLEFHDYRAYCPGDDLGEVDWKLFGRTDKKFVKRFTQQTDMQVMVVVDCSASMGFSGWGGGVGRLGGVEKVSKFEYAAELAAAIGWLVVKQSDRVGLALVRGGDVEFLQAGGTAGHLGRMCTMLENVELTEGGRGVDGRVDWGAGLAKVPAMMRRRGVAVCIGDFLDEAGGLFEGLGRLRHAKWEAVVFQVLTREEIDLGGMEEGELGRVKMVDAETGARVTTDGGEVRTRYAGLMAGHLEVLRRGLAGCGADYQMMMTGQPVGEALGRFLRRRGRRGAGG